MMDPAEKKRKLILGAALVATLIAVVLVDEDDEFIDSEQTIQPVQSTRSSSDSRSTQEHQATYIDVDQLGQRKFSAQAGDLFGSTSWVPKRPQITPQQQQAALAQQQAARQAMAPPAPTPPPLQFTYIGKAIEGNRTWAFLSKDGENYVTKIGQKIDDKYRLDTINDEVIMFTYLPLNAKQTLAINDNKAGNFR
jgi:hypothetical protein